MKANRLIWALLLVLLGGGCNKQTATSTDMTNKAGPLPDFETSSPMLETIEQTQAEAKKGDVDAHYELGVKYFYGQGVAQDGSVLIWILNSIQRPSFDRQIS